MTIFVKPEKPRISGREGKGYICTGALTFGIGITPKDAYMSWKTRMQVMWMRGK